MSDPSYYHREYSPDDSYSLFQFETSDAISVLKNSIEYSFVFFACIIVFLAIHFGNLMSIELSSQSCFSFIQGYKKLISFFQVKTEENNENHCSPLVENPHSVHVWGCSGGIKCHHLESHPNVFSKAVKKKVSDSCIGINWKYHCLLFL